MEQNHLLCYIPRSSVRLGTVKKDKIKLLGICCLTSSMDVWRKTSSELAAQERRACGEGFVVSLTLFILLLFPNNINQSLRQDLPPGDYM